VDVETVVVASEQEIELGPVGRGVKRGFLEREREGEEGGT